LIPKADRNNNTFAENVKKVFPLILKPFFLRIVEKGDLNGPINYAIGRKGSEISR